MWWITTFCAMAPPAGQDGGQQSPAFMFVWLFLMLGIFYMLLIRPQQRREKERKSMIESIKTGDRVVFGGGIVGVISNVKEKTFSVKIADNVKIEALRGSVTQVLDKGAAPQAEDGSKR